jgi:preflagellin peptidase FlaK
MIETMIYYAAILVSLIGLLFATYTDLKARIVPNKLNYGLAVAGLIIFGTQSILVFDPTPLLYSILGLIYGFTFGWILWKIGVFAGGDVKLFMGLGALNPLTPALIKIGLLSTATIPLFPISLFLYSLIAFLPYGLFVICIKVMQNEKIRKEIFEEMKPKIILAIHSSLFAAATYAILSTYAINTWFTILALIIWGFFGTNKKYVTLLAIIAAIILNLTLLLQATITAMLVSVVLYTIIKLLFSTRKLLSKEIKISQLEEGMIPAKTLVWKGKKVVEAEAFSIKQIIKYIKQQNKVALNELLNPKNEIISARKARGLTEEELKEVKKLAAKGLIGKKMLIKDSMPFVPTMLLGYILCLILGDFALMIIMGLL